MKTELSWEYWDPLLQQPKGDCFITIVWCCFTNQDYFRAWTASVHWIFSSERVCCCVTADCIELWNKSILKLYLNVLLVCVIPCYITIRVCVYPAVINNILPSSYLQVKPYLIERLCMELFAIVWISKVFFRKFLFFTLKSRCTSISYYWMYYSGYKTINV